MQNLLDAVKGRLHIHRTSLHDETRNDLIAGAKMELIRSGVKDEKANDEGDALIRRAIIAYCQWQFTDDEKRSNLFFQSFTYQQDCIRKSSGYMKHD